MAKLRGIDNFTVTENGCHEYAGKARTGGGYPNIFHEGKYWYGHRLSWTKRVGPIPAGLLVLHKCDNRSCMNVDHLFLGTMKDNSADMRAKGRGNYKNASRGENHGRSPFIAEDIRRIREASLFGAKTRDIANAWGVAFAPINNIIKRKSWAHLE